MKHIASVYQVLQEIEHQKAAKRPVSKDRGEPVIELLGRLDADLVNLKASVR